MTCLNAFIRRFFLSINIILHRNDMGNDFVRRSVNTIVLNVG